MDKEILVQYCEMKEEIRDLRERIRKLDKFLENPPLVADIVKGTRRDGTIGSIKVTGIPEPEYIRKHSIRADDSGGRVYPVHTQKRAAGYVPAILHRRPDLVSGGIPNEPDVSKPAAPLYGGQLQAEA